MGRLPLVPVGVRDVRNWISGLNTDILITYVPATPQVNNTPMRTFPDVMVAPCTLDGRYRTEIP